MPGFFAARAVSAAGLLALSLTVGPAAAEDWPHWRGPRQDGSSKEIGLPVTWSRTENVRWKVSLPAPGNSTPIVSGGKVFVTQSREGGAKRGILCFAAADGKALWTEEVPGPTDEPTHQTNPIGSSSPLASADGKTVYAWLGSAGVLACTAEGKRLWLRDLGKFTHIWGYGSSPVLHENLLILNAGPGERAFVVALDTATGKTVWEIPLETTKADAFKGSWSSPKLFRQGDKTLLLVGLPKRLVAYDPADGSEVWTCSGLTDLVYTTPLVGEEVAVAMSGYHGKALAVRLGGVGDVTESHRLWLTPDNVKEQQRIGSGIILAGKIYSVNEPGLECLDLISGKSLWKNRLGKTNWTSLVHAEDRLYFTDQAGTTHVVAAKPTFEILAQNPLEETVNGSLAASNGLFFLRTHQHLWCLGR